jgi:ornithine carbamoyltransferase
MPVKDFLSIRDFTPHQIRHYLHVATQLKAYAKREMLSAKC